MSNHDFDWSKAVYPLKWIFRTHFLSNFSGQFCQQGVHNKDPIIWLERARPFTIIPPPLTGNAPAQLHCSPPRTPKKYICKFKKWQILVKSPLLKQKSGELFCKLSLGNRKLIESKIQHFLLSDKVYIYHLYEKRVN